MRTLITLCLTLLAGTASAQDSAASQRAARQSGDDIVREIERGYYIKGGAGLTQFVGNYSRILYPVMGVNLAVGQDFVDKERSSLAWELIFNQTLQNGPNGDALTQHPATVQGDVHTFAAIGVLEASTYPTRRLGLGVRAGAGVMAIPVLMFDDPTGARPGYTRDVVTGSWGGQPSLAHHGALPMFVGGPTIEYYTKLSHFSVGVDVDVQYVLNLDLGVSPNAWLKYTF